MPLRPSQLSSSPPTPASARQRRCSRGRRCSSTPPPAAWAWRPFRWRLHWAPSRWVRLARPPSAPSCGATGGVCPPRWTVAPQVQRAGAGLGWQLSTAWRENAAPCTCACLFLTCTPHSAPAPFSCRRVCRRPGGAGPRRCGLRAQLAHLPRHAGRLAGGAEARRHACGGRQARHLGRGARGAGVRWAAREGTVLRLAGTKGHASVPAHRVRATTFPPTPLPPLHRSAPTCGSTPSPSTSCRRPWLATAWPASPPGWPEVGAAGAE